MTPQPLRTTLSVDSDQADWTPAQNAVLAELNDRWHECPPAHRLRFLHAVQASGLDPFLKQIFTARDRDGAWFIQAHIDGLRLAAQRAAERAGEMLEYEDPTWIAPDGSEHHRAYTGSGGHPHAVLSAVIKIRDGVQARIPCEAYWDEYCPAWVDKESGELFEDEFWLKRPLMMLGKCCESAGLRKAYPGALSAIFEPAEVARTARSENSRIAQEAIAAAAQGAAAAAAAQALTAADGQEPGVGARVPQGPALADAAAQLFARADAAGFGDRVRASLQQAYGVQDPAALDAGQAAAFAEQLRTVLAALPSARPHAVRLDAPAAARADGPSDTAGDTPGDAPRDAGNDTPRDTGAAGPAKAAPRRSRARKATAAAPADAPSGAGGGAGGEDGTAKPALARKRAPRTRATAAGEGGGA